MNIEEKPVSISEEVSAASKSWSLEETLRWAFDTYDEDVAIASAFGPEGIVVMDVASRIRSNFRVFILDTGYLFPETFELIEKVEVRYGICVERVSPALTPDAQSQAHGPELWRTNPDQCCGLRKLEPLARKLAHLRAWITGIRRDQTTARRDAKKIEWDSRFGLTKLNPLIDWSHEMVWEYIRRQQLDYNRLHNLNYPSIGCIPCTSPVPEGSDPRSGRWLGFDKSECGLHRISPRESLLSANKLKSVPHKHR